ncbi:hypothetical protein L2E82_25028 [Cichorium intybus]|uniref:Uncharacterized protein n=1 Tax=Cichorium intybus TaxID=13427 RepID=A0ACB9E2B6_CICIN|nr:hypothetical protein L2E82_25028 [Cichorium intybus]
MTIFGFQSSYGFVDYFDRRYATLAIVTLNGRHLFGQRIKVNWAYAMMQEYCGIRRRGGRGDLDLFLFVTNRMPKVPLMI